MRSDAAGAASFRFSRDDVVSRNGLAIWREVIGRTILQLDIALLPDRPFHSEAAVQVSPGLHLTFATKSGLRMERSRALLADGKDDFGLHICTAGTWIVSHRSRETPLGRGDAVLVSDAEIASVTCPSLSRCTCVQLPRKVLAPMVPDIDDALMRAIPKDSEALRLLIDYVDALKAKPLAAPGLQQLAAAHVRDLMAVALGASRDGAALAEAGGIRAARLHAIKADIVANLDRDDLSVNWVAARRGVTQRYVQMLFEAEGTTFSQFVLSQRLARAHRLIADPRGARHRIGDIAFDVGFGNLSYFNRAFRRQYGLTPSDLRATALSDNSAHFREAVGE